MRKRVTIVLDDEIIKKLRKHQAHRIVQKSQNISFSKVINEILEKSLKK